MVDKIEKSAKEGADGDLPKKAPKKVTIVDANEVAENTPLKQDESGDTPPVKDVDELKEIEEKIQDTVATDEPVQSATSVEEVVAVVEDEQGTEITNEMTVGDAIDLTQKTPVTANNDVSPVAEDIAVVNDAPTKDDEPAETQEVPEEEFDDTQIEKAVDDIVASEGDELLARQDEQKKQQQAPPEKKKRSLRAKIKEIWSIPSFKWGLLVGVILIVASLGIIPAVRYSLLNTFGVRAGLSLTVINSDNQQPLKNASVVVLGQTQTTDEKGSANFTGLKLGKAEVVVSKRGYTEVKQAKTLGWGSNPLGQVKLGVSGAQFSFVIKDFLSQKAVLGAEAVSGDFNAQADQDGKILLPLDQRAEGDIEVTIKASDYREEKVVIKASDTAEKTVVLAPSKQHVFVTKRTGKLDVYKVDADGKNETMLMAATGSERDDIAVLPHPSKDYAAIVSTREGKRNKDGYLMSNLYVVNVKTGEPTKLPQSERIQLIDWAGDRILYIAITEGASAANPARSKIFSYEIGQPGAKEIASANYFNDAVIFRGAVHYAPSSYSIPVAGVKYFRVNADGSSVATLLDKEVWNIFRSDYDTLLLSVQQDWYEQKAGAQPTKLGSAPANPKNRIYRESPDKKRALWVDNRDGKGVLLAYNTEAKNDDTLHTQAGLVLPVSWLNNTTYVYRISDGREIADYVKSTEGGEAVKLKDVTNTEQYNYFNY